MKKFYKLLALLVCAVMVFSAGACNNKGGDNASTTADGTNTTVNDEAKTYTVGISQLVQHVALDAATKGFKDALTAKLGD
ncbi:MAG TPA: ABC transporter substrate-binding protein, partial [Clostridiales bacterium]|nr:ABC transporter substrate-binding protein [Clostridiales bacterium]